MLRAKRVHPEIRRQSRFGLATHSTFARETRALPFPEKFRRAMNFRWEAFVHGTIERGLLKDFPVRVIGRQRNVNF